MTLLCARPACQLGTRSTCSGCGCDQYCSSSCQKLDWKTHKSLCPILKKLSHKLQPFNEVVCIIAEILASNKGDNIRILEHLLSYAENQFGKIGSGKENRERDGQQISNWDVDIDILLAINSRLVSIHGEKSAYNISVRDDKMRPYLERSLCLLSPWLVQLDSNTNIDSLSADKINFVLSESQRCEEIMATVTINKTEFNIAEGHCKRCLIYSKKFGVEGEKKNTMIFRSLRTYVDLRRRIDDHSGAVAFAEEAYNVLAVAYDPTHPQVQEAAGLLTSCLTYKGGKGDLNDAKRYSEQTYGNLKDHKNGMNQESEEVAEGAYNLADAIIQQNGSTYQDLVKAEGLAREALRIRTLLLGKNHLNIGISCNLLARILRSQYDYGDETRKLFERSLEIFIANEGPNGLNVASGNSNIGRFHLQAAEMRAMPDRQRKELLQAKKYFTEAVRIKSKIHGRNHPSIANVASMLAEVLKQLSWYEHE